MFVIEYKKWECLSGSGGGGGWLAFWSGRLIFFFEKCAIDLFLLLKSRRDQEKGSMKKLKSAFENLRCSWKKHPSNLKIAILISKSATDISKSAPDFEEVGAFSLKSVKMIKKLKVPLIYWKMSRDLLKMHPPMPFISKKCRLDQTVDSWSKANYDLDLKKRLN